MARSLVPCAGALVLDSDGRLLVIKRRHAPGAGLWSLPGGRIEPGESAAEAAAREVLEETGLVVQVGDLLLRLEISGYDVSDFGAVVTGGTLMAGDDAAEARWATLDELASLPTSPGLLDAIDLMRGRLDA